MKVEVQSGTPTGISFLGRNRQRNVTGKDNQIQNTEFSLLVPMHFLSHKLVEIVQVSTEGIHFGLIIILIILILITSLLKNA